MLKGYSISAQEDEEVVETAGGDSHPEQQSKPTLYPSTVFSITAETANLSHIQSDVIKLKSSAIQNGTPHVLSTLEAVPKDCDPELHSKVSPSSQLCIMDDRFTASTCY